MEQRLKEIFDLERIRQYVEANIDQAEWIEVMPGEKRKILVIETLADSWHGHHIPSMILELFGETDGYDPEDPHYSKEEWICDTLTLLENSISDALNELLPSKGYYYIGFHEFDGSYSLFYEEEYEEENNMIEVVVIEAGPDYLDKLEAFEMELPTDEEQAVAEAMKAVKALGYTVIPNGRGGCCAYVHDYEEDWIAITVEPSAEEGK